ncbi:hypothetical protein LTR53_004851 [Teratosphaeriaceae sp. CCFEE 6253]|nr:hypothetical protein LTR53_004851 [Teratosphaeriaceae sp. CCFEE 6253]
MPSYAGARFYIDVKRHRRDLFMPTTDRMPAGIYSMHYVVNAGVRAVFVRNESDSPIEIPAGRRVGTLHEFDFHGAYLVRKADHGLTALNPNAAMVDPTLESRHGNGATLYGSPEVAAQYRRLINDFPYL